MPSPLSSYLRAQIKAKGMTAAELADKAGVPRPTLSNILQDETKLPRLDTLDSIARTLDVELGTLLQLLGYDLSVSESRQDWLDILVEAMPELRGAVEDLSQLTPEQLREVHAYIAGVRSRDRTV